MDINIVLEENERLKQRDEHNLGIIAFPDISKMEMLTLDRCFSDNK